MVMDLLSRHLIKPCSEELLASDGKVDARTKYPLTDNDYMGFIQEPFPGKECME